MEWTPEKAVAVDQMVRAGLRSSRAGLMRFLATDGWRSLPDPPTTAAAYVQDVAGVKRSEAYRIVATARVISVLATYVDDTHQSEAETDELFRWILDDVIKSTHTGEWLTSILSDLMSDLGALLDEGMDPRAAIDQVVTAHPRPEPAPGDADGLPSPTGGTDSAAHAGDVDGVDGDGPGGTNVEDLPKAERILVCPHCGGTLR